MYRVVITQEPQTNEAKSGLYSRGMNAASSVKRPMNRDLHVKNSVLANSKNSANKVPVDVRKNKQTDNTSTNVISNKENVIDVNVVNASKAKTLLCVLSSFICASLEPISAIEELGKRGEVWEQNRVLAGFGIGGMIGKGFIQVGCDRGR
ncbi:hypothetical protein Tco_1192509 [Tanacetum coccineum]